MWLWCFSLFSKEVFEGAEGNLLRIFEKNRSVVHRIKELPLDEPRPNERLVDEQLNIYSYITISSITFSCCIYLVSVGR